LAQKYWRKMSAKNVDEIRFDFTNVFQTPFMLADPKSAKDTDHLTVFFALLGSLLIKA